MTRVVVEDSEGLDPLPWTRLLVTLSYSYGVKHMIVSPNRVVVEVKRGDALGNSHYVLFSHPSPPPLVAVKPCLVLVFQGRLFYRQALLMLVEPSCITCSLSNSRTVLAR